MPESAPIIMGDPARDSLTGKVLGEFEIGDRVGSGGGGEVYRAQDTSLKVIVALKRLPPALRNDAIYRRRFKEEAQRAAQLGHSNRVAHVYRVLEEQNEICLIMEFVEGETLRQRLVRPILLKEFLHIASQCAEALVAAHSRGIIHGDIKPENIMLTLDGQVKILDFGVAKQMPVASDMSLMERDTIDPKGTVSGTPAYMAPEVLREGVDGRADIFSLGIVFYEALTGKHPFSSEGFGARSGYLVGGKPVPAGSLNPDVSKPIDRILDRMLAKKPADRYPSALELLDDLDRLRNVITPLRGENPLPQPAPKKLVRKGFLLGAAAVLGVVLASWGVYAWMHRLPVMKERGWVLISDFESVGDDPLPEKTVHEGLTIALQQSRYVNLLPRDRVYDALKRMKRSDATQVDENLARLICLRENVQVLLAGSIVHLGNAYQITVRGVEPVHGTLLFAEQEHFNRQEDLFDKVDVISRKIRTDLGETLPNILNASKPLAQVTTQSLEALRLYSQAKDAIDQGNPEQAEPLLKSAVEKDPKFAMAHMLLSNVYDAGVGKNKLALAEVHTAYELRDGQTDREKRRIEANYFDLQERYDEEVEALKLLVRDYPDDAEAHHELAEGYYNVGRLDGAIVELREFLRLNPLSVKAIGQMMVYLVVANRAKDALDVYEQARPQGMESPELHVGLGQAYLWLDRLDEAQSEFQKLELEGGLWRSLGMHYLAKTEVYQGKLKAGVSALDASIDNDKKSHRKGFELKAHFFKGQIFLLQNQKSLAAHEANLILAASLDDVLASDLQNSGILFARAGDVNAATRVLRRLVAVNSQTPSRWNKSCMLNVQGEIALAQKQFPAALVAYHSSIDEYAQVPAKIGLAQIYDELHDWPSSILAWQRVLDSRGEILHVKFSYELGIAHMQIAHAYRNAGNEMKAQEHYATLLKMWKNTDQIALRRRVELEMQTGTYDR